jgi:hypothetical protein
MVEFFLIFELKVGRCKYDFPIISPNHLYFNFKEHGVGFDPFMYAQELH